MVTEKYILDDARQWFIVRKLKHVEDYETTYRHLRDDLSHSLSRFLTGTGIPDEGNEP